MRNLKKYFLFIFFGFCIVITAFFVFKSFFNKSTNNVDIRVGYDIESINNVPIIIAHERGLFNKHGLVVNLIPLKSGKEIAQTLAIGGIDIGSAGVTNFFIPISKGAPVKIIAPTTMSPTYVYVRPDSHIETLGDLAGKTIASSRGESSNFVLQYVLKRENIDVSSITFLDIEDTYRPIALMEKKIVDAVVVSGGKESLYKKVGAVILKEWETKGYINKTFPRIVIAVNADFVSKNPKKVEKFIDAFIESQRFVNSNPKESAQLVSQYINLGTNGTVNFSPDEIQESWRGDLVQYLLWYDPSVFVDLAKISKEIGDIENVITLEQIFDLRFEQKLKAAQIEIYNNDNNETKN